MTGKKCKIEGCIAPYEGGSDHQRVYHTGVKWNSVNIQHDNPNDPCSPFICPLCPQGELVHSRYNSYALSKIMSQHHDPEVGERYPDPHLMPKLLGRKRKPGNKRKVVNPSPDTQANTPPDTGDSAIGNEANPTNPDPEPDVPEDLETKNKQPERKSKAGDKRRVVNPSPDAQVSIALDAADSAIGDQVNSTSPDPEPKVPKDLGTKKKQPEDIEHLQARLERHMLVDNTGNMVAEDEEVGFDPSIEPKPTKGREKEFQTSLGQMKERNLSEILSWKTKGKEKAKGFHL
ncbi:hypothetical protein BDP27DRAFT_1364959 [Rhodocollybia butyracea]|uniref:Uncharacterized protein n=1 Tax=Rhodocollybia butyracea TaxID=206335 RepID=A0A9P5PRV4_9AGAR|nr:hypothetical protein BDP27DRAFT_1364959 [Rhodocollybia butyracea]